MSNLLDSLNTIETTFTDTANKIEDTRKPLKERLQDKYENLVQLQSKVISIDAGGNNNIRISTETINNSKYKNMLQKELKQNDLSKPIFLDISERYFLPMATIMRNSQTNPDDKMLTVIIDADKDILCDEIRRFFEGDADKVIDKCDFIYSSKSLEYKKLLEDEKRKKEMLAKIWDKKYKIKCYQCGRVNDGTYNRLKYSSTRNDEFVIDGHYATCKSCDPNATYKA